MKKKFTSICFIGPDGSGKSTLAHYLFDEIKKKEIDVAYFWWLEGENTILRQIIRFLFNLKTKSKINDKKILAPSSELHTVKITKNILARLYMKFVFYEYCRFSIMKIWSIKYIHRQEILILDRFMYDIILFLSNEFLIEKLETERLLKKFSKILPNPDLFFIIDVDPETAYLRKPDEILSVRESKRVWDQYQQLYSLMPQIVSCRIIKINNTRDIELVKTEIIQDANNLLGVSDE
jgi:thymidylate kinase